MANRRIGGIDSGDPRVTGLGGDAYDGVTYSSVPVVNIPNLTAGIVSGPGKLLLTIGFSDRRSGTSDQFSISAG